jgi:hypothetical protein
VRYNKRVFEQAGVETEMPEDVACHLLPGCTNCEMVMTCGLAVDQRTHHQITGEPMKFLTLADWTGTVETELFAPTLLFC